MGAHRRRVRVPVVDPAVAAAAAAKREAWLAWCARFRAASASDSDRAKKQAEMLAKCRAAAAESHAALAGMRWCALAAAGRLKDDERKEHENGKRERGDHPMRTGTVAWPDGRGGFDWPLGKP